MEDELNPNFDAEFGEPNYSAIAPTEQVSRRVPFSDEAERSVVGTMFLIGRHKMTLEEFEKVLCEGTRSDAGESMPGNALFLWDIIY